MSAKIIANKRVRFENEWLVGNQPDEYLFLVAVGW
jgi:hypothetical protein